MELMLPSSGGIDPVMLLSLRYLSFRATWLHSVVVWWLPNPSMPNMQVIQLQQVTVADCHL